MKISTLQWKTYKEVPAEAKILSHQLLIRAGLIHKTAAGIYSYMPLALRVIEKIKNIIRHEMDEIGGAEILMSMVTPADLWKESGRWDKMGSEMLKFKDAGLRDMCLSPTNEETVTDIFKELVSSYKQLPLYLYQINTKFRDEMRPRFGLMRGREFIMKDGYSFHLDMQDMDRFYSDIYNAYENIFMKMGLQFSIVEADGGAMAYPGAKTHEFQVIADEGEDELIYSQEGYGANLEKAQTKRNDLSLNKQTASLEKVETKNLETCADVANFLNMPITQTLKSLLYTVLKEGQESHYLLLLLGDDELNEIKLKNALGAETLTMLSAKLLDSYQIAKGYIGPHKISSDFTIVIDREVSLDASFVVGANEPHYHLKNFIPSRDLTSFTVLDIRQAKEGDIDLNGHKVFKRRGIEVGHIFQLGEKYTKAMSAMISSNEGKPFAPLMGCYGIGVTRTLQAAIAQNHDENGIVWPLSIAPYHIYFGYIGKSEDTKNLAQEIYTTLKKQGFEVLFDDRNQGFGAMVKDADLLGLPFRLILGERDFKENGLLEITYRKTKETQKLKLEDVYALLAKEIYARF